MATPQLTDIERQMFVRFIVASQSQLGGPVSPALLICGGDTGVAEPSPLRHVAMDPTSWVAVAMSLD